MCVCVCVCVCVFGEVLNDKIRFAFQNDNSSHLVENKGKTCQNLSGETISEATAIDPGKSWLA